ncbi:unnamed protein product, partial [Tetraodon nigroviridis]
MSIVTVQLGQCGNQVGHELFDTICADAHLGPGKVFGTASRERFFHQTARGELVARAVLVDMEPKVVKRSLSRANRSGRWRYGEASYFCQKQGSGNNWANGYCVLGPRHRDAVEDLVRREVERCERLSGLLAVMSVAGGTGSGVGTYLTQRLRDAYPRSFILNHLTWPYGSGEVIVQNYNSALTLAHLYQLSDAILVHENDTLHGICAQLLRIQHISFTDINRVVARQLAGVLQPALTADSHGAYGRNPLGELVSALACHPEYKLLSVSAIPQIPASSLAYSAFSWPGLLKHLRQMLISNTKMEEGKLAGRPFNASLANLLVLRGKDVYSADTGGFEEPALYTPWLPAERAFHLWKCPVPLDRQEKSATLVSNSQALLRPLDHMVAKAWNMFASRAYVHQYHAFGISEENFLDSFTSLEQILSSYTRL